jgi:hypothetical protein
MAPLGGAVTVNVPPVEPTEWENVRLTNPLFHVECVGHSTETYERLQAISRSNRATAIGRVHFLTR